MSSNPHLCRSRVNGRARTDLREQFPNGSRTNDRGSSRNSSSAYYALFEKVQGLGFRSFLVCVMLWLGAKGFGLIQPLGRVHRRGRRRNGGADFLAMLPNSEAKVAISVRHWNSPLQRRVVDELWGYMLRNGVPMGLIVTNSRPTRSTERATEAYPGRPIQIVSCRQLCSSMAALELGVCRQRGSWILDEAFFRSVESLNFATALAIRARLSWGMRDLDGLGGPQHWAPQPGDPRTRSQGSRYWVAALATVLLLSLLLWMALKGRIWPN